MNHQVNSYFAALLITIVGAVASLIIIHVAYANTFIITMYPYTLSGTLY